MADGVMNPRINLNGASKASHVNGRQIVFECIDKARDAVGLLLPHGRDYPGDSAGYERDRSIHAARMVELSKLYDDVLQEALAIQAQ
jgi:hypothetical protein